MAFSFLTQELAIDLGTANTVGHEQPHKLLCCPASERGEIERRYLPVLRDEHRLAKR